MHAERESERRVLTLIPSSAIVVSSMIGTGIFTTTGLMVEMGAGAGDVLLGWLLGGVVALCGSLCYGEIGASLPESGGECHYLSRLLHPALGFISGWVSLIVGFAAPIAASAIAMNIYIGSVIPGWPVRVMSAVMILVISLLHAYDLRFGSRIQISLTALKVFLIAVFVASVALYGEHLHSPGLNHFKPTLGFSSSFAVILVFVSFAYSGWNAAAYVGSEIKKPERNLPLSLLIGTVVVTLIYLVVNLSYLQAVPVEQLSGVEDVARLVGEKLWGGVGGSIIASLIALTLIVPMSAMIMTGPRVAEAMARDQFLPAWFGRLNDKKVPTYAVWFQAILATAIALTSSFGPLLIYIGFTLNIFAALTVFSLFRLRSEGLSAQRVCIGYPLTPVIFIAFAIWMTVWSVQSELVASIAGMFTFLIGYALYIWNSRKARSAL